MLHRPTLDLLSQIIRRTLSYECFSTNAPCLDGSTISRFSSKYINKMPSGNLVGERKNTKILKKKNVKEEE